MAKKATWCGGAKHPKGIRRPKYPAVRKSISQVKAPSPLFTVFLVGKCFATLFVFVFLRLLRLQCRQLYLIPGKVLWIDPRTCKVRQTAFSQVELEKVAHQRLHGILGLVLDLVDSPFETLEVVTVVVFRVETEEAFAFVVVQVARASLA